MGNKPTVTEFIMDGFVNILTSIGIKGKDKLKSGVAEWTRMMEQDADLTYAGSDVARNIVDLVPREALQKGFTVTGLDAAQNKKVMDRMNILKVREKFVEAGILCRIHGGAGIFLVSPTGKQDSQIGEKPIKGLVVMSRWNLRKETTDLNTDIMDPRFEQPDLYTLCNLRMKDTAYEKIHYSRIVEFDGLYLPPRLKQTNENWGDSVLNVCLDAIRNYESSHQSAALVLQDFSIPVMKLKDMANLLNSDCDDQVKKRLEFINLSKSIAKLVVVDADNEDFTHATRNVTGFKDILEKVEGRLVTASHAPHTKLFGNSPSGMGGTGRHEETNWYDYLMSYQTNDLKDKLLYIAKHIAVTEFGVKDTSPMDIAFEPLWALDETEEATVRKTTAETDQIYIDKGVLTPDEVAKSRFGGSKYSTDTIIDMELRKSQDFGGGSADPEADPEKDPAGE